MTSSQSKSVGATMDIDDNSNDCKPLTANGNKFHFSVYELRSRPLRAAAVGLGLLCVVLLAGVIGQRVHYNNLERDQQNSYNILIKEKNNLQENLKATQIQKRELQVNQSRLQANSDHLSQRRDQLQTNVRILAGEKSNLLTSQSQLQSTGSALTKEIAEIKTIQGQLQSQTDTLTKTKNMLSTNYTSALAERDRIQSSYKSLTKDINNLQNQYNIKAKKREELQTKYNSLVQNVEHLQLSHNFSISEKDKLNSSHADIIKEINILQDKFVKHVQERDQLQTSYDGLIKDRDQFQIKLTNITTETSTVQTRYDSLKKETEQLQKEVDRLNAIIGDSSCLTGWRKFEKSCYFTSLGNKNWVQSQADCQSRGSNLVIIDSQEEMDFINSLYPADAEVWIGLSDRNVEGQWKWVDGTALTTSFWGKGQPNSHNGNQDCVEFWHHGTRAGDWNDEQCDKIQHWICET